MKVAVFGDSFAASQDPVSWTRQSNWDVDNFATNGSSEYRILKTLKDTDISRYDLIIVVHTSANRIYVPQNPLYKNHDTHSNCDLIYLDMYSKPDSEYRDHVVWWFENVFDLDSAQHMHELLIKESLELTKHKRSIHLTFFENLHKDVFCLYNVWQQNLGNVNHLNLQGNQLVADFIKDKYEKTILHGLGKL